MIHVLVTGCGYIGSVLCGTLLQAGYRVTAMDNFRYGPINLAHLCSNPSFDFIPADVRHDGIDYSPYDVIIPLAALVGAPVCEQFRDEAYSVNVDAISRMTFARRPDQLIIYPNSNSGYGTPDAGILCTEDMPMFPISWYGSTKCWAEYELLDQPNTIALRLATVFGMSPRMRLDLLVNDFVYRAVTDGYLVLYESHFKRNYIHVRDVADCFIHCIENAASMVGQPYNAGLDSANLSKLELAQKIKEHVPGLVIIEEPIAKDPDQRNYVVSNQRLRDHGFEARRGLDEGIEELIKGYKMMGRGEYRNC